MLNEENKGGSEVTRKLVSISYTLTIIMLTLMIPVGAINTYQLYRKHGWIYKVTTIINGVETIETINLMNNLGGLIFIVWILFLLIYTVYFKQNKKLK